MTSEVQPKTTIKASDINQLVNAVNNPQISVVGQGLRSSSIGGAMTISQDTPLKGDANAALPQLFSIKAGPSKKWIQKDATGKVYPSLYVYLGPSPAMALESVNISDNVIAEGDHPRILLYFNLSKSANWKTHAYEIDQVTGEVGDVFDPIPDSNANSILKCMVQKDENALDGWYELPTSPLNAMPMWAVCYVSIGVVPVLALCTVDETRTAPDENSGGIANVEQYSFMPDLSKLLVQMDITGVAMYRGLVGSPIKLYDLNAYSTDDVETKFDPDGKLKTNYLNGLVTLYNANSGISFENQSDKAGFTVKPVCNGKKDGYGKPGYDFHLMIPYKIEADDIPGSPYSNSVIDRQIKKTVNEDLGTMYTLMLYQRNGAGRLITILDCTNSTNIRQAVGQNVNVFCTTSSESVQFPNGNMLGLSFTPDYEDESVPDVTTDGMILYLQPYIFSFVTNSVVYVPRVTSMTNPSLKPVNGFTFLPPCPEVMACAIYPNGESRSIENRNFGNFVVDSGKSRYLDYGIFTPPYESTSLLHLVSPVNTDTNVHATFEQYIAAGGTSPVLNPWAIPFGSEPGQFASLMYENCVENLSTDDGDTWTSSSAFPSNPYLELYGFNRFDTDRKVNFYPEEAVKGIEAPGTGSTIRKDFDFVIRKRCELGGDESEGANIAYMRGFVPDTVLDEGQYKCRTIQFYEGSLEKDGVPHTALSLYDFHLANALPVVFDKNCKKLSEGYGNKGRPNELNMVARYWQGTEQEINYLDLDFTWIVDSLTACIEGLGPYYPSGGGGGIQELGQVVDELSARCDLDYGDFWVRGRDYNYNYGTSIGDHTQAMVINLTSKTLEGQWACNDDFTAETVLKVNQTIEFYGQGPIQIVDNNGDTYFPENSLLTEYDVATEAYTSDRYKHLTATFSVLDVYTQQVADQIKALHDLIKAQATTIQNQATTIQSLRTDVQALQTAVQTLQQTVANHEQRLQNGGL